MKINKRQALYIARHATMPANEEPQCVSCFTFMSCPPELDPSPLCNVCAQESLSQLAEYILEAERARKRRTRSRA